MIENQEKKRERKRKRKYKHLPILYIYIYIYICKKNQPFLRFQLCLHLAKMKLQFIVLRLYEIKKEKKSEKEKVISWRKEIEKERIRWQRFCRAHVSLVYFIYLLIDACFFSFFFQLTDATVQVWNNKFRRK